MRKLIVPAAMLAVCLMASASQAGIVGSAHDFSSRAWSKDDSGTGQICLPCHEPHNATLVDQQGNLLDGPLWNHQLSVATYTMYQAQDVVGTDKVMGTLKGTTGAVDQNSKLCLSCHDGTVALDSFGGNVGSTKMDGPAMLGTDLSNDHPIGERAVVVVGSENLAHITPQAGRTAAHIMPLRSMADGRTVVGCSTCHEPHNRKNNPMMLWVSQSGKVTTTDGRVVPGSGLCLECHAK